ncbi:MAG TPA: alpha/beta fold hydrolase [Burkholderiales bacterium]
MPPLVFLHGVGGGKAVWDRQVEHFNRLGYRCAAWDQPGYGQAAMVEPYEWRTLAEALKDLVGDEKPVLVAHSMGGLVAQEFYARYPESVAALALCFTSAAFAAGSDFARAFVAARIGPLDAGKTMGEIAKDVMPAQRGRISDAQGLARAEHIMAGVPPATYRKAIRLVTTFDRREDLQKVAVPSLLIAGSDDVTAPPQMMERMAQKIPGAEFVVLRGCGHLGPMDQPDAFNKVLEGFLKRRL